MNQFFLMNRRKQMLKKKKRNQLFEDEDNITLSSSLKNQNNRMNQNNNLFIFDEKDNITNNFSEDINNFNIVQSGQNYLNINFDGLRLNKYAIFFITTRPDERLIQMYNNLYNNYYSYFVIVDDNSYNINNLSQKYTNFHFIQLKEEICKIKGYSNLSYFIKNNSPSSWDKALYILCEHLLNKFKFVWFIDENVFIPTKLTIQNIDCKYISSDLLIQSENSMDRRWNHFNEVDKHMPNEFKNISSYSLVYAFRLSNNLLYHIRNYINKYKKCFFMESFFPTLSRFYQLKIDVIPELKNSIIYNKSWNQEELEKTKLYYPVKDLNKMLMFYQHFNQ